MSLSLAPDPFSKVNVFDRDAANLSHCPGSVDELITFFKHVQNKSRDQIHKLEHKRNQKTPCKWPEYKIDCIVQKGSTAPSIFVREEWQDKTADLVIKQHMFSTKLPECQRPPLNPFRRRFDFVLETFVDALAMHDMMNAEVDRIVNELDCSKSETIDLLRSHLFNAKLVLLHLNLLSKVTDNAPSRLMEIRQLAGAANDALANVGKQDNIEFVPVLK
jgi:hypothetical protein